VAFAALLPAVASAQFKCESGGRTVYQQTPCGPTAAGKKVDLTPAAGRVATQPAGTSADERVAAMNEAQRAEQLRVNTIATLEMQINNRNQWLDGEMARLRAKQSTAANNLAGATYQQSLAEEMQAATARTSAQNAVDLERLKVLRGAQPTR